MVSQNFDGGVTPPGAIARICIGDILRRTARRLPGYVALIDGDRRVTYDELDAQANRLAHHLIAQGAKPGDRCSTICANTVELVAAIFALHRAGLIWVPINLMLDHEDVEYTLTHAGVTHAIIGPEFESHPNLGDVVQRLGIPYDVTQPGFPAVQHHPATEPDIEIDRDDIAAIIYTSGTTSKPKGAMHTHQSIFMAVMSNAVEWSLTRTDGIPLQLPLFHCGAHCLLLSFMMVGARCVLLRGFDAGALLRVIDEEQMSVCVGLPMMYSAMLDHPDRAKYSTKSLRFGLHTMAPMFEPLMRRMIDEFCPTFMQTSGQTEMYPITTISMPDRQLARFGNYWGEAAVVNDMAIMDDDGNLLPPGQIGELVHRGPNVMFGYYKNPEATAEARKFGWHHTGDLGLITEDGEFQFLDRKKDMIKTGGENVSTIQVEEQLLACPEVEAAIAVGLPHPRWGEAVTAFVVARDKAAQDPAPIMDRIAAHLGGFQMPKKIVFVDSVPTTATGKLRKVELRQQYQDLYTAE